MEKILLAVDGSEASMKAVDEAIKFANAFKAEVDLVSVVYEQPVFLAPGAITLPNLAETRKGILDTVLEATSDMVGHLANRFKENGLKVNTLVIQGKPAEEIIRLANDGSYNLVILGSRGLSGVKGYLLGSVSNKVANSVKTTVLIVRQ
ncbi:MAG: universal stress protein [Clostridia bacterium]|nr:universal stress protein [Clostridia bacterium]